MRKVLTENLKLKQDLKKLNMEELVVENFRQKNSGNKNNKRNSVARNKKENQEQEKEKEKDREDKLVEDYKDVLINQL